MAGSNEKEGNMLFQVYGDTAVFQWIGWVMVLIALILRERVRPPHARPAASSCFFGVCRRRMTVYCIAVDGRRGAWAPSGR